jgi:predicted permease
MRFEHWRYTLPLRLRSIFRRDRVEHEMEEELAFHLELKIEEGIAMGLPPDEARRRATRALAGLEQRKEEMREARRVDWLLDFAADVRFALRGLRRTPGLAALVVVTLALGVGMTATPFSMLDALVFRPYPVPRPHEIVTLSSTSRDDAYELFSHREYLDLRAQARSYAGVVASLPAQAAGFAAAPGESPRVRSVTLVSGDYFRVLGVEPELGRGFRDDEDAVPGRDAVVVLGHDFWANELGAEPAVVGRTVRVNGADFTVVGVAPASFPGMMVFSRPDLYAPLAMAPRFSTALDKRFFDDRDDRELVVRGRLLPGISLAAARAELSTIARDFAREHPQLYRDRGAALRTQFEQRTRGDDVNWKFGVVFLGLAVATLLVACTNVAGLLLSRARSRSREIAVRLAMGAGRFRLVRLLLTESLVLALLGGALGVAIGWLGIDLMQRFTIPTELPVKVPFRMDGRVLAACLAMSALAAVACGLAPALQSTGRDLVKGLKAADVDEPGRRRLWGRNALVVAQVAMSLMLLTAAFVLARSFQRSVVGGLGFDRQNLLLARFDPRLVQYDAAQTARFYERLAASVRELPGVRAAGLTRNPPLGLGDFGALAFVPDGLAMPAGRDSFTAALDTVDPGFFAAMGIDLVRGRAFTAADDVAAPRVAIVNERFAERYFPGADAVGRRLRLAGEDGATIEIVGVARTVKYMETTEKPLDFVYLPVAQQPTARLALMVRAAGEPLALAEPLRRAVSALDPDLPISELRTFDDLYRYHVVEGPGVAVKLAGTLGGVGLVLAVAGLYGLVAYNVARRTREIGIRMAIGARPSSVLRLMMGKGLALVGVGTAIGLVLGVAVERALSAAIFDAGRVDVVAFLVVVPAMLVATAIAAWIPARRAARIAPTQALRCE